jgi:hypothetical protein
MPPFKITKEKLIRMISNSINSMIEMGQPLYKISCRRKSCKIAHVVGKLGSKYGNMILVRFKNGSSEYVMSLNGVEGEQDQNCPWFFLV